MAIIGALCGCRSLRKQSSGLSSSSQHGKTEETSDSASRSPSIDASKSTASPPVLLESDTAVEKIQPPMSRSRRFSSQLKEESPAVNCSRNGAAKRRLMGNLSMRMPRSVSMRLWSGKEEEKKAEIERTEDSVWMKTIILGERCRVPVEEDDDAVFYDEKGNRFSTYHPRTPRSLPVSRTCSYIDPSRVPPLHGLCELE